MSFLKKEEHIFSIDNSITKELCKDILEIFEKDIRDDVNVNNINENHVEILLNENYGKIQKYLIRQLHENIELYKRRFETIDYKLKIPQISTRTPLIIKKQKLTNNNVEIQQKMKPNNIEINKFLFLWFLNEYDGEILFWDTYKIKPKLGRFVLIPISWCFNYCENIKLFETQCIIYGIITV
uniref:Uncharacterized protein n=1 Tax=viral metagenome TaxID=1070528 RepID=A0A6C0HC87_9ZZZZ